MTAEEMREKAARHFEDNRSLYLNVSRDEVAARIRSLPLPDPEPEQDSFKVPEHVRRRMEIYYRVHEEMENGKSWDEIDIGFRDGQRSTYDGWLAYMQTSLVNSWKSEILREDHCSVQGDDEAIDAILERHQGAITKTDYKAAGDDIRRLLAARDGEIARLQEDSADAHSQKESWLARAISRQQELNVANATIARLTEDRDALSVTLALTREALDRCLALDPDGSRKIMDQLAKGPGHG